MSYNLVPVTDLASSPVLDAYYGEDNVLAWTWCTSLPYPYPHLVAQLIDGVYCIDELEAEDLILDLWDEVFEYRHTGELPEWWEHLNEQADSHWICQQMLDHLDDI